MIVEGVVVHGRQIGRRMGFPTANVRPAGPLPPLPENGVYAAAVWLEGEALARPCMLNQGVHPTVPGGMPTIEAHLLGYSGDLYGRGIRVEYLRFLRPEKRFDGLEQLKAQLARDARTVADWLRDAESGRAEGPEARRAREIRWAE